MSRHIARLQYHNQPIIVAAGHDRPQRSLFLHITYCDNDVSEKIMRTSTTACLSLISTGRISIPSSTS